MEMICYKDMTFCHFGDCTDFDKCKSALTLQVRRKAEQYGLHICQYANKPSCFRGKKNTPKEKNNGKVPTM